jgi:Big-like domain-containing protein
MDFDVPLEHVVHYLAAASGGVPTGTVTVKAGSSVLCTASVDGSGHGSCTLSSNQLSPGTYSITATYGGASGYKSSTTSTKPLTVD